MEDNQQPKWEAIVTAKLTNAKPHQIWPFFTDFFNLHKWLPTLPTCYGIHGVNGEPGCIRYCSGSSLTSSSWSKERLVAVDHVDTSLRYEILESNIGFNSYVSTVKIVSEDDGGCRIEWSFEVDPVEGLALEYLVSKYQTALQLIAKRMEDQLQEQREKEPKWEGKVTAEVKGLTAEQAWFIVEDFCNLHKWFPGVKECYHVEGEFGKPGLVRYCGGTPRPSSDGAGGTTIDWVKETMVVFDPIQRILSYEVIESNMGFKSYVATFKLLPVDGIGCKIDWSFVSDPIQAFRLEDFKSYMNSTLQHMAKKMEETVPSAV